MSEPYDFHGWRISGKALSVGYLPGRKQPALYLTDGGLLRPLAYFQSEDKARQALDMIDKIAKSTGVIG